VVYVRLASYFNFHGKNQYGQLNPILYLKVEILGLEPTTSNYDYIDSLTVTIILIINLLVKMFATPLVTLVLLVALASRLAAINIQQNIPIFGLKPSERF
jgi:hypothetical protein